MECVCVYVCVNGRMVVHPFTSLGSTPHPPTLFGDHEWRPPCREEVERCCAIENVVSCYEVDLVMACCESQRKMQWILKIEMMLRF